MSERGGEKLDYTIPDEAAKTRDADLRSLLQQHGPVLNYDDLHTLGKHLWECGYVEADASDELTTLRRQVEKRDLLQAVVEDFEMVCNDYEIEEQTMPNPNPVDTDREAAIERYTDWIRSDDRTNDQRIYGFVDGYDAGRASAAWVRIESEADLPKEVKIYWFARKIDGQPEEFYFQNNQYAIDYVLHLFNAWAPKIYPPPFTDTQEQTK